MMAAPNFAAHLNLRRRTLGNSGINAEPGPLDHELDDDATRERISAIRHIEPVDLWARYQAPKLPTGLLPATIENYAVAQAELMGVDPGGLAMASLAVCAAAIPDRIRVQVKQHDPHWHENARLWVALIGPPSAKKSPIMNAAARPLGQIDSQLFAEFAQKHGEYMSLASSERKDTSPPKQRRVRLSDTTIEAAQEVLKDSPDGVLLLRDELSGWFGAMDKYSSGKGAMADRGFWLEAYNGGPYAVNRTARGASLIPNLSVSILGGIQPEPLRKIANDAVDDGLIQRLVPVILGQASVGQDLPRCGEAQRYDDLVHALWKMSPPRRSGTPSLCDVLSGYPLQFDDAAHEVRRQLEVLHHSMMATETISGKMASHFGKYDGLFARLCVIWHCIEAHGSGDISPVISGETAGRVRDFLHSYIAPSAVAFYVGTLGLSDDHDTLVELAAYILAKGMQTVSLRVVQRANRTMRGLSQDEGRLLCEKLESLGWLLPMPSPRNSRSPHWQVNAMVHLNFAKKGMEEAERRERAREMIRDVFAS